MGIASPHQSMSSSLIQCEILLTHFTYTCILNNLPLTCEFLPLCRFQDLSVGHGQVPLAPFYLMSFFHCFINMSSMSLSYIIHGNHMLTPYTNSWEPCTSMSIGALRNSFYLAVLAILFYWVFFQDHLCLWACLVRNIVLTSTAKRTSIILLSLPHTTP